jgi:hypothetical protein
LVSFDATETAICRRLISGFCSSACSFAPRFLHAALDALRFASHFLLRTPVTGDVGRVFKAVGVALPPNIREVAPTEPVGK